MNNKLNKSIQSWALFLPEIKDLLREKKYSDLKSLFKDVHPIDIADSWDNFEESEKLVIFNMLEHSKAVEVFEELDLVDQELLLGKLEDGSLSQVLEDMPSDEKAKLFHRLPSKTVRKLISLMKKEDIDKIQEVLKFPKDTAGALVNTDFIDLKPDMTAKQALEKIQRLSRMRRIENLYAFYVIDNNRKLMGGVSLKKLIAIPQDMKISEIMSPVNLIKIKAYEDQESVAQVFSKYDLTVAPVVDNQNGLLGIIVIDDVVDLIQMLDTKQLYEIGMMSTSEGEDIDYANSTPFSLVKRRIGWLVLLLALSFLSGTVLEVFSSAMTAIVSLTFFIPMLLGTGGNAGAQTSITVIRALATGEVTFHNIWKVVRLELMAAFIMAFLMGLVTFVRVMFVGEGYMLALVVGFSMGALIVLAVSTGLFLPMLAEKLGLDPAVLSSPITQTIVDVVGLIIYFKIAILLFPQLRGLP